MKSAPRASAAQATETKYSFIPAGYENTRREELQRDSRKNKAQASQLSAAQKATQIEQSLKQEVLNDPEAYIRRVTRRLKNAKMSAADTRVHCLWILKRNATTYSAHILAILDWAWFPAKHRIMWSRVAFGTFHWLQARTMFTADQKADYERQLHREGMELNDLEAATQRLWQDWVEADEMKRKQQQAKAAAQRQLPPERRATQLEWEKQARVTGLGTSPGAENRYPGWVVRPRKKPSDGHDPPMSYQTPSDVRKKEQTIDERNAALADELGANDVLDPLGLSSPGPPPSPGPQTPPQFEDADINIPSISLPGTLPITSADNQLLGAEGGSPMETASASTSASTSTVSTPSFSRAPGLAVGSVGGTPMSLTSSPAAGAPPLGLGRGAPLYLFKNSLLPQIAFEEALRRNQEAVRRSNSSRAQQIPREERNPIEEEPESPYPDEEEEDEDWK